MLVALTCLNVAAASVTLTNRRSIEEIITDLEEMEGGRSVIHINGKKIEIGSEE
jgi:hypothetical protein